MIKCEDIVYCGCANVDSSAPVFSLKGYNKISPWILNLNINETEQFHERVGR